MPYNVEYSPDEEVTVTCKFISENANGYTAEGLRHEDIEVKMADDVKYSVGTEENKWYQITGEIKNVGDWSFTIEIDSESEIDPIGRTVNDWIFEQNGMETHPVGAGKQLGSSPKSFSGHQQSKRNFTSQSQSPSRLRSSVNSLDTQSVSSDIADAPETEMSGFATGGGKDINNFRGNIENGYLPHPDSMTTEGLLYDYEFNIGRREKDALFYPNYSQAVTRNPLTDEKEHYLAVGLDSGMTSFERPPLDLMLVVDISGSMGSEMTGYYYDEPNTQADKSQTKMSVTRTVIKNIIKKLNENDRLGIILYDNQGFVAKPMRVTSDSDTEELLEEIETIQERGGTNLSNGYETAIDEFEISNVELGNKERESRVMFLTDAMPNQGMTGGQSLFELFEDAAENNIYTTFIGVGIDSNPELIESLSGIKGANHYFIDDAQEFRERIDEEFDYAVTPLVFDLKLTVEGEGFQIDSIFGSPNEDAKDSGTVMDVKTLFPSTGEEGTKGGVILLRIDDITSETEVRISVSWKERDGTKGGDVTRINIDKSASQFFDSEDVRKAVLLSHYSELMKEWLESEKEDTIPESEWEQESQTLHLTQEYKDRISEFREHFENEMEKINDDELIQEIETLDSILSGA